MKRLNYIILFVGALLITSCGASTKSKNGEKTVIESFKEGDYDSITLQRIIDGSKENAKILQVVYSNSTMKDGKVKFKMSKREFKKEGLDGETYDKIQALIKDYNKMVDSDAAKKAQASIKDFLKFASEKLSELAK